MPEKSEGVVILWCVKDVQFINAKYLRLASADSASMNEATAISQWERRGRSDEALWKVLQVRERSSALLPCMLQRQTRREYD